MVKKNKSQRKTIQYLWNKGIRDAKELHKRTSIALSTIYDNISQLKKMGSTKCTHNNRHPQKMTSKGLKALKRFIHQDSSLSTRTLTIKLSKIGVEVSHMTIK